MFFKDLQAMIRIALLFTCLWLPASPFLIHHGRHRSYHSLHNGKSDSDDSSSSIMDEFLNDFASQSAHLLASPDLPTKQKRSLTFTASPLVGGHAPQTPSPFYSPDFVVQHILSCLMQDVDTIGVDQAFKFTQLAAAGESSSLRVSWRSPSTSNDGITLGQFNDILKESLSPPYYTLSNMDDFSFAGLPQFDESDLSCYIDIYTRNCDDTEPNKNDTEECFLGLWRFHLNREAKVR